MPPSTTSIAPRGIDVSKLTKEEFELLKDVGYSAEVIDLYMKKIDVGVIENPTVSLTYTGPCGDTMKFYLKINDDEVIEDIKFQYLGCPAAASSGSALTRIVKGKTLEEAKKVTKQDILRVLRGLPETKLHCPKLAVITLHEAIIRYEDCQRRIV